jgi:hypothetical protein
VNNLEAKPESASRKETLREEMAAAKAHQELGILKLA